MKDALSVLLVDDNPDDRLMVRRSLAREFASLSIEEVREARGLSAALNRGGFDIVITDYHLQWNDGLAVLRAVKERQPAIPVIMFTGTGTEEVAVEAMKNGLDDYVLKSPKHVLRLPAAVRAALTRAEARSHANRIERELQSLLDRLNVGVFRTTPDGQILNANPAFVRILDFAGIDEARSSNSADLFNSPADRELFIAELMSAGSVHDRLLSMRRRDRRPVWVSVTEVVSQSADGQQIFDGILEDVTERRLAAEKHDTLFNLSLDLLCVVGFDGYFKQLNPAWEKTLGWTNEELQSRPYLDFIHPDDRMATIEAANGLAVGKTLPGFVNRYQCKDGSYRWLDWSPFPVFEEHTMIAVARDITQRKQDEEALRASERALRASEEQLRQAQKMEAIGRLAGGIAHDFNNILTAILGHSYLLASQLAGNATLCGEVEEIRKAGERAAGLTRQLLAFSRKQILLPEILSLNTVVINVEKMLRRVIGEDIDLTLALDPDLGSTKADPGQVEQVILNLAVNARDAMPRGGKIMIETRNVTFEGAAAAQHIGLQPGEYVMLGFSDTGQGMDAETQSHVFEPFFTTKEMGKGTGLGLSMVDGFIRQSGGHIWLYSELGRGTTFKIYLPRVEDQEAVGGLRAESTSNALRGTETILIVEDDSAIRSLTQTMLQVNGYTVLAASSLKKALDLLSRHTGKIDLILTDVVMSGGSGPDLVAAVETQYPGIRCIFMSGYTDDAITRNGALPTGVDFLEKPFTLDSLARKIRTVLDRPGQP